MRLLVILLITFGGSSMSSNKMQELIALYSQANPQDKYPNFMKAIAWAVYTLRHNLTQGSNVIN